LYIDERLFISHCYVDAVNLSVPADELRGVIAKAKKIKPQVRQYIIATKQGRPFTASGFSTACQRTMAKTMENGLEHKFHFHDLRAKSASDGADLLESSERLGHSSPAITQRVYRRKPTRMKPLR
jgi:integrase